MVYLFLQLATLLGCVIGIETSVSGITLIALGTSLPDTFASRTAAKQDEPPFSFMNEESITIERKKD
jgi:Ca2+/Na+ antiporter